MAAAAKSAVAVTNGGAARIRNPVILKSASKTCCWRKIFSCYTSYEII